MATQLPILKKSRFEFVIAETLSILWAIVRASYSLPAFSAAAPSYTAFASESGNLPSDAIWALAFATDGALRVGTVNGLALLGKDGRWQTSTSNAFATGTDGTLRITAGGGAWLRGLQLGSTRRACRAAGGTDGRYA